MHSQDPLSLPPLPVSVVVTLQVPRKVIVDYKTHVGLVYSHPESDCCNYDIHVVFYEEFLISASFGIGKACVVWKAVKPARFSFL